MIHVNCLNWLKNQSIAFYIDAVMFSGSYDIH